MNPNRCDPARPDEHPKVSGPDAVKQAAAAWVTAHRGYTPTDQAEIGLEAALIANQYMNDQDSVKELVCCWYGRGPNDGYWVRVIFESGFELEIPAA